MLKLMALISPHDEHDVIFENLVLVSWDEELPPSFMLDTGAGRDQVWCPTCAAFSGATIAEYHAMQKREILLPEFIYINCGMSHEGMYG